MSAPFRLVALPVSPFAPLFGLSDDELARRGARRQVADAKPGYPCRVSLVDAEPGERLILLPYNHHDTDSPYRGSGPIYVREGAEQAVPAVGEVPPLVRNRLLSYRGYDADGMMRAAEVATGAELEGVVGRMFGDPAVAYVHLHNAKPGCFSCRVERA